MIRWIRVVLPSSRPVNVIVGTFGLFYLFIDLAYRIFFHFYGVALSGEFAKELADFRTGTMLALFVLGSILYGMHRLFGFHPLFQPDYRTWLQSTPWTSDKPLPLGPVHLVWQDLLIVLALGSLAVWRLQMPWFAPLLLVLLPYLVSLTLTLGATGERAVYYALAFGFGLLVYVSRIPTIVCALAAVLYFAAYLGLHRSLTRFPWRRPGKLRKTAISAVDKRIADCKAGEFASRMEQVQEGLFPVFSAESARAKALGWPFDKLSPQESLSARRRVDVILFSLLVGWYLYALNRIGHTGDWDPITLWFLWSITAIFGLIRICVYCAGYAPPISLLGRILTGRLIIPGYDQVFLGPICAMLTSIVAPLGLHRCGLPLNIAIPISASLTLMVLVLQGPSLPAWRLTGRHRLVPGMFYRADFIKI
jgi:hypothetical protein